MNGWRIERDDAGDARALSWSSARARADHEQIDARAKRQRSQPASVGSAPDPQLPLAFEAQPKRRRSSALASFKVSDESPVEALAGEESAKRQEDEILEFFRYHDDQGNGYHTRWTPSEAHRCIVDMGSFIHETFDGPEPILLLTSVRRAISNLTRRGLLQKHPGDRRLGPHGSKECTWSLA